MTDAPARPLLRTYAYALLIFLALDAVWLGVMGPLLYRPALGGLLAADVQWVAAALFYPLYVVGLLVLAIAPALSTRQPRLALRLGAVFGFVAYATYDLTNQATLRDWPWTVTLVDLVWGTVVSGTTAWAAAQLTCRRETPARGQ